MDTPGWTTAAEQNRAAWDEIAEIRAEWRRGQGLDAAWFRSGGVRLPQPVRRAVGEVDGRTLIHLQCSTGEESMSWATLGARVTAVDISDAQIRIARQTAASAGIDVEFVTADVGSLPETVTQRGYDIVYTATGVLTWIPDIERWATVVASLMASGGTFVLFEEHPVASCLWGTDHGIEISDDYFSRHRALSSAGWSHFPGGGEATVQKTEFHWPLGDVVTALVDAGLRIRRLEEFPAAPEWRFGVRSGSAGGLPGLFLLVATA